MSGMIKTGPNKATPWTQFGWPKRCRDWEGVSAYTKREMQSGMARIPARTRVVVVGGTTSSRAVRIETGRCEECGISIFMSRVHWRDLDVMETMNPAIAGGLRMQRTAAWPGHLIGLERRTTIQNW